MNFGMMPLPDRIRKIRMSKGLKQTEFAKVMEVTQGTVSRWENSRNPAEPDNDAMVKIAKFAGVTVDELLDFPFGESHLTHMVRLAGTIEGGAIVRLFPRIEEDVLVYGFVGAGPDTEALQVKDSSLGEGLNGWLAYYDKPSVEITSSMIGEICVAWLEDGRVLVRQIIAGQKEGTHTLRSSFAPPIYDERIQMAARIIHMKPGK